VPTDGQTHRQTDRQTDRHTDANRFYNLSHAICYSYGTDKKNIIITGYISHKTNNAVTKPNHSVAR